MASTHDMLGVSAVSAPFGHRTVTSDPLNACPSNDFLLAVAPRQALLMVLLRFANALAHAVEQRVPVWKSPDVQPEMWLLYADKHVVDRLGGAVCMLPSEIAVAESRRREMVA